jgi:aspartyl protease family protein
LSSFWKFAFVVFVTGMSGLTCAEAVVAVTDRGPVYRAANAQAAMSQASAQAAQAAAAGATIPKAADGHYWADGQMNGAKVRFLVDTGATAVALTPADARRLGFDVRALTYSSHVVTAAGNARAASVKLASLTVAGARLENVDALVIEKGLDTSLLGMTYLGRLASFQATREALILHP